MKVGESMDQSTKKATMLLIVNVLKEYSDEHHLLTQQDLIDKVKEIYHLELERKSIASSLALLIDLGYGINKSSKGGYYLKDRILNEEELNDVIDSLLLSKNISQRKANDIIDKIYSSYSRNERRDYSFVHKSSEVVEKDNSNLFLNLNLVNEAMKKEKKISFEYQAFDSMGKPLKRKGTKRVSVSPYYVVTNEDKYFLICNKEKKTPIRWYRIDFLINPLIEEDKLVPLKSFKGMKEFSISKYVSDNIYLLGGEVINATILIENPKAVMFVRETFSKNAKIYRKDGNMYADIKCNESALYYFVMKYSSAFKVLSPESLINRIKEETKNIMEKYYGEN